MRNLRADFPIFTNQPSLVYLDTAATSQKPQVVIDAVSRFYTTSNANIHRGLYPLSAQATEQYEQARQTVASFIGAKSAREIIFTRGATEGLNLLAQILGSTLKSGQNIILSDLEHHSNLIPWQQIVQKYSVELRFLESDQEGNLHLENFQTLLDQNTAIVSLTHCSNVMGTVTPIALFKKMMQEQGSDAILIVDASQSVPHFSVSVQELDCDFLVFSGHKLYGPSGTGVLWGREELLAKLPPYQTGGDMVKTATLTSATWNDLPWKFEAGTPNIEGVIGLAAAINYIQEVGLAEISEHTQKLHTYAWNKLSEVPQITLLGKPDPTSGIISFTANLHPHDLAGLLGEKNICIRAGHHCAAPLHEKLGVVASNRISIGAYTTQEDIDAFLTALVEITKEVANV